MAKAKLGDTVKVHYTGKLEDGVPFDTSRGEDPLQFRIGDGRMIPGFEEAVVGMEPGESKNVTIPPEKGYGLWSEEKVLRVPKDYLPPDVAPEIGTQVEICMDDDRVVQAQISDVADDEVILDANYPLCEKVLTFEIELVDIL